MYEESEPVKWSPDDATWAWLQKAARERYGGDLGRCLAGVLREARIADETVIRGAVPPGDLRRNPWRPLDERLRRRRSAT